VRVLITGSCGYIGSVLSNQLLNLGYEVTGIDNLYWGQNKVALDLLAYNNFKFINLDLTYKLDRAVYIDLIKQHDVIIPLAALVGAPLCDAHPKDALIVNFESVMDAARVSDHQLIIYPNTNSSYGSSGKVLCTETTPVKPISHYARTKQEAEKYVLKHTNSVVFRLATVFGISPRMRLDLLVNNFAFKAHQGIEVELFEPDFMRNYVHVNDVVGAFIFAIKNNKKMNGQIYNLGNDSLNMSKRKLADTVGLKYTIDENQKDPDQRNYIVSSQKLARVGFTAKIGLDETLPKLQQYFNILMADKEKPLLETAFNY
jgi:nucleoside-diphosphate-sugar epimerase